MLGFVICGPEHSGTTVVSDVFRQIPGVGSGFEVGVLLAPSPRHFPALTANAEITCWSWGITESQFAFCCDTDDFAEFYQRLQHASTVLKPGTHTIFDKTPRYLSCLRDCLAKTDVPVLVIHKDPRATVYSDWRRAGEPPIIEWYIAYLPEKIGYLRLLYAEYLATKNDPRVFHFSLEELCLDTRRTCQAMFNHAGQTFDLAYLALFGTRDEGTRHSALSSGIPLEYRRDFVQPIIAQLEIDFADLQDWFYN
jgi:hypothetical protein